MIVICLFGVPESQFTAPFFLHSYIFRRKISCRTLYRTSGLMALPSICISMVNDSAFISERLITRFLLPLTSSPPFKKYSLDHDTSCFFYSELLLREILQSFQIFHLYLTPSTQIDDEICSCRKNRISPI